MFKILNIFEIISNYIKDMKDDLNWIAFFIVLIITPIGITFALEFWVSDLLGFVRNMITITSIFIPLLLNVLMIIHYSIERTVKTTDSKELRKNKLEFLKHINSTTSAVIVMATIVLIISVLVLSVDFTNFDNYLNIVGKFLYLCLVVHMFLDIFIVILRIYRLITFEISEFTKKE